MLEEAVCDWYSVEVVTSFLQTSQLGYVALCPSSVLVHTECMGILYNLIQTFVLDTVGWYQRRQQTPLLGTYLLCDNISNGTLVMCIQYTSAATGFGLICTHFLTALICLKSFFFLKYWEKGSEIVNDLYDKFYYWKKLVLWRLRLRKTLKWLRKFRFNWQAYLGRLLCGIFEQLWEDRVYGWLLSLLCRSR